MYQIMTLGEGFIIRRVTGLSSSLPQQTETNLSPFCRSMPFQTELIHAQKIGRRLLVQKNTPWRARRFVIEASDQRKLFGSSFYK